ncbi:hypothetical protein SAMN05216228_102914 [Rhizobium tibeticum]|uniref:Prevent-host-death family protein n=1 Tax=Rhizobium tibeticum TaxID=501024 RepID=A0A1H8TIP1_9HYPH|nr:hypothetical protein [Rhizobium tibeticum]SEI15208.1 hypothetical protein RTCCBAU85039_5219 [Rhizobium tibeticum]SEO90802.1 hypothetical protein SAMN05216228_102914 [Rhizobium tibeticum]
MTICVEIAEAAERLEELIDLALRDDEVVSCREGNPVAVIVAIAKTGQGNSYRSVGNQTPPNLAA